MLSARRTNSPTVGPRLKIALLTGIALALSACGFQPLLGGTNMAAQEQLERIRIGIIADRSGQILRNYLVDDLTPRGVRTPAAYQLQVRLSEPQREVAIRRDDSASRISYSASATFQLLDAVGRPLFSGNSQSETTFEVTNSEFATLSGLTSARDRVLQEVSADIRLQLAEYFSRR